MPDVTTSRHSVKHITYNDNLYSGYNPINLYQGEYSPLDKMFNERNTMFISTRHKLLYIVSKYLLLLDVLVTPTKKKNETNYKL